jgi:hypothetical protein
MAFSDPTPYVSTGDLVPVRNALSSLYAVQRANGELPWAGPAIDIFGSDTYHAWTLIETANYYLYTLDSRWLARVWDAYVRAMAYLLAKVDRTGLLYVTGIADWARTDMGGDNLEANSILYRALVLGQDLATLRNDYSLAQRWSGVASRLKIAANRILWDPAVGAMKDNPTSHLYPQDGNSLAIWFGLVASQEQAKEMLHRLEGDWGTYGAVTPEWGGISPFAASMEVMARFQSGDDQNAVNLIRREWGYMLNAPFGTASTLWEGMSAHGTLVYGGPYESLAHGWSTGPTSALTAYVAGLQPVAGAGRTYSVTPHPADVDRVQASLAMSPGRRVTISWQRTSAGFTLVVDSRGNHGSIGHIALPTFGAAVTIRVDGNIIRPTRRDSSYAYLPAVGPGRYVITAEDTT